MGCLTAVTFTETIESCLFETVSTDFTGSNPLADDILPAAPSNIQLLLTF